MVGICGRCSGLRALLGSFLRGKGRARGRLVEVRLTERKWRIGSRIELTGREDRRRRRVDRVVVWGSMVAARRR